MEPDKARRSDSRPDQMLPPLAYDAIADSQGERNTPSKTESPPQTLGFQVKRDQALVDPLRQFSLIIVYNIV
jgi:hypothetical protein